MLVRAESSFRDYLAKHKELDVLLHLKPDSEDVDQKGIVKSLYLVVDVFLVVHYEISETLVRQCRFFLWDDDLFEFQPKVVDPEVITIRERVKKQDSKAQREEEQLVENLFFN